MAPDSNIVRSPSCRTGSFPNGVGWENGTAGGVNAIVSSWYGRPSSSSSQEMRRERVRGAW